VNKTAARAAQLAKSTRLFTYNWVNIQPTREQTKT